MKRYLAITGTLAFLLAGMAQAQGVVLRQGAVVYLGSPSNTTAPAVIDDEKVRDATPEWRTILAEGVKKGSARYKLLMAELDKRVREAVRGAAAHASRDLVVRAGDIEDARGKDVADLTPDVVSRIDQMPAGLPASGLTPAGGVLP